VGTAADWNGPGDPFRTEVAVSEPFFVLGWWFVVYGTMASGVLAGATAVLAWRTGVFPRWYAALSVVVAIACVASVATWGLSILAVVGWVLLTSVAMLAGPRSEERLATAAA
jgi:hypothetical protein